MDWDQFYAQDYGQKAAFFQNGEQVRDVLFARQFGREYCRDLFALSDHLRGLAKSRSGANHLRSLLSDKRAMLFFVQPSTRTFLSFQNACHLLGMQTSEIRDPSTSSEAKGETKEDTLRTFSSYVDLIVMRHPEEAFAEKAAWLLRQTPRDVPVINGGSGKDEHPTQALLDLYTLERGFAHFGVGGIAHKRIALVGDLRRGRTVRSLAQVLTLFPGVELDLVAPLELQMGPDILQYLKAQKLVFRQTEDLEAVLTGVDAVYMTRIQNEHDQPGGKVSREDVRFHLTVERQQRLREHALILHPFPRRAEIAVEIDSDPRAQYWRQERNGMWVRAALILHLLGRATEV